MLAKAKKQQPTYYQIDVDEAITQKPSKAKISNNDSIATKAGEKNAFNQLAKFDKHFNDADTNIRYDGATSNKDGSVKKRYIVSQNGKDKYEAKFVERDKKQKLEQIISLKRTKQK